MKTTKVFRNTLLMAVAATSLVAVADEPAVQVDGSGWDIYKAGVYNYGPSIMVYDDGSIDAWFAAPGGTYQYMLGGAMTFDLSSTEEAVRHDFIGQHVTTDREYRSIQVCCPTWNHNGSEDFTMKLYKWDTNLSTTLKNTPVYTHRYENFNDNEWLKAYYSTAAETDTTIKIPAGDYLWTLTEASEYAGVWTFDPNNEYPTENFISSTGRKSTRAYKSILVTGEDVTFDNSFNYWDQASYRHSTDGGVTWTTGRNVLRPTYGSRDHFSVCDPGVAKWGGYYYCGYTSTENSAGIDNHVYIARSANPDGPWEKWNGTGWGGNPQPIVEYTGDHTQWGAGEPSIVVKDGTVYFYYSWNDNSTTTRVGTASADDPNWPGKLEYRGVAVDKTNYYASDHTDVKYVDAQKQFIAYNTTQRFTTSAYVQYWTSNDGIRFTYQGRLQGPTLACLHNLGVSGDSIGHVDVNKAQYIAYAYGSTWAKWNTRLHKLQYAGASAVNSIKTDDSNVVTVKNHTVEFAQAADVDLYDVTGHLVQRKQSAQQMSIDTPGVYVLRYATQKGRNAVKIVVK